MHDLNAFGDVTRRHAHRRMAELPPINDLLRTEHQICMRSRPIQTQYFSGTFTRASIYTRSSWRQDRVTMRAVLIQNHCAVDVDYPRQLNIKTDPSPTTLIPDASLRNIANRPSVELGWSDGFSDEMKRRRPALIYHHLRRLDWNRCLERTMRSNNDGCIPSASRCDRLIASHRLTQMPQPNIAHNTAYLRFNVSASPSRVHMHTTS